MQRFFVTLGVVTVLLFFFSVPLGFIVYFGVGHALGGAMILGPLILIQVGVLAILRRVFPAPSRSDENVDADD